MIFLKKLIIFILKITETLISKKIISKQVLLNTILKNFQNIHFWQKKRNKLK